MIFLSLLYVDVKDVDIVDAVAVVVYEEPESNSAVALLLLMICFACMQSRDLVINRTDLMFKTHSSR